MESSQFTTSVFLYAESSASCTNSFGTLSNSKVVAPFSPHLLGTGKYVPGPFRRKGLVPEG